ncbi:hypothetical protein ABZ070_36330, partial [Streptomyces sp. NPDC006283]|uniref:hypothetical protein n=1 Tax=Streptomyces sp. NPDC006283 TaxID=3156741 RepID=UPI0033B536C6
MFELEGQAGCGQGAGGELVLEVLEEGAGVTGCGAVVVADVHGLLVRVVGEGFAERAGGCAQER